MYKQHSDYVNVCIFFKLQISFFNCYSPYKKSHYISFFGLKSRAISTKVLYLQYFYTQTSCILRAAQKCCFKLNETPSISLSIRNVHDKKKEKRKVTFFLP